MNEASQLSAVAKFRAMHESGCFVLPNPWDVGTAVYLQHLGFQALATTSAGVAFTRGVPDATPALPLEDMLAQLDKAGGSGNVDAQIAALKAQVAAPASELPSGETK